MAGTGKKKLKLPSYSSINRNRTLSIPPFSFVPVKYHPSSSMSDSAYFPIEGVIGQFPFDRVQYLSMFLEEA